MEAETTAETPTAGNHAVVVGELATEPDYRILESGSEVMSFSLTVRRPGEATTSVPFTWFDPPKRTRRWKPGIEVVAAGPIVRRFYRAGGATGSRTDVVVARAESLSQKARARAILAEVGEAVDELTERLE